ncbi:uncharacterized protein [Anoplolepis gracilipes]|uniref:uncharacterized protein n=1 Tax=Anoplolepis gracilipes TaxID=354296 RepID=UPI003B9E63D9
MSIRRILSPLLIISYVCGLRIIEFPAGVSKQWFGLLYMLLLWSLYSFVCIYEMIPYTIHFSTLYHIWFGVNMFLTLLSIFIGIYHDKEFRNCIKDLTTVNNTLKKLGTITDYKLYMRTIWLIIGWFMITILLICVDIQFLRSKNYDVARVIYTPFIRIYCVHINVIGDLTITTMLGYVGLKFDQINEYLEKLMENSVRYSTLNKRKMKRDCKRPMLLFHQSRQVKTPRKGYIIWIVIHLHLELRKISRKINLIFGTQMTIEMGCYFAFIAMSFQEVIIFITHTDNSNGLYVTLILIALSQHIFRLFLINYECERVSIKILQFLLITQTPFRFCGLGFFQFGFKYLQKFGIETVRTMINNIRTILTPLLIISFVSGLSIVDFSTSRRKARFCLLYILLLWSIYFFVLLHITFSYLIKYNVDFIISFSLTILISLMSVIFGMHYNKKFKNCLKKIAIVDDTLEHLGIMTDYQKLHTKIVWLTLGWSVVFILMIYLQITWLRHEYDYNIMIAFSITFVINYCSHVNFISNLIIVSILGYIGLKFDQINENLWKLTNECRIKQAWKNHVTFASTQAFKIPSNKCMTWIVIHLHLELCKISREINSIFGMQMTLKMGLYFGLIASCLRLIFTTLLRKNYLDNKKEFLLVMLFWNAVYASQVLLINCICERINVKANTIGGFINKISYSTCDVIVRENISQLLLQVILLPLRFYGIGLFQFGFKFLYGFSAVIATVVVILVQAHVNRYVKQHCCYVLENNYTYNV